MSSRPEDEEPVDEIEEGEIISDEEEDIEFDEEEEPQIKPDFRTLLTESSFIESSKYVIKKTPPFRIWLIQRLKRIYLQSTNYGSWVNVGIRDTNQVN